MTAPPTTQITSRGNPLLVRLRKLATEPAAYRKFGEVWLEGEHLCGAYAARGGLGARCVISESGWATTVLRELAGRCVAVSVVADPLFATFSGLESPASIGFVVPWVGSAALRGGEPTVLLDRLQDAGNVGSAALWSPKVVRAGMGAHFALNLVEQAELDALAGLTIPLLATSSHASQAIDELALPWPCGWVFGHEGQGVSEDLMRRCSQRLAIPQPGGEESLNVGAAAAVCLYESARQRRHR